MFLKKSGTNKNKSCLSMSQFVFRQCGKHIQVQGVKHFFCIFSSYFFAFFSFSIFFSFIYNFSSLILSNHRFMITTEQLFRRNIFISILCYCWIHDLTQNLSNYSFYIGFRSELFLLFAQNISVKIQLSI